MCFMCNLVIGPFGDVFLFHYHRRQRGRSGRGIPRVCIDKRAGGEFQGLSVLIAAIMTNVTVWLGRGCTLSQPTGNH